MDLFTRARKNPVVTPGDCGEAQKVYNPGVIWDPVKRRFVMFLRAHIPGRPGLDEWRSEIWRAYSADGLHWTGHRPFLVPDLNNPDELRGFEDPRIVYVEGFGYVLTYARYDGKNPVQCVATSPDLETWTFHGPMPAWPFVALGGVHPYWEGTGDVLTTVDYNTLDPTGPDVRSKSGSAVPKLINGRLHFVEGEGGVWRVSCKPDITDWQINSTPLLTGRPGTDFDDNVTVEAGGPLIWRPYGWLMLYHGINEQRQYHLMMAVLSHDLTQVLWRSDFSIFGPREAYETKKDAPIDVIPGAREALSDGDLDLYNAIMADAVRNNRIPGVVFASSCQVINDKVRLTYGAGDLVICVAEAPLASLDALVPEWIRRTA